MTLGARLSALHRGIYRTPVRACVLQGGRLRAQTAPESFTELMLGRPLLVAAGRTGFARVRRCKLRPRGTAPVSAFGVPRESALVTRRDARAYTLGFISRQEETSHDQRGNNFRVKIAYRWPGLEGGRFGQYRILKT